MTTTIQIHPLERTCEFIDRRGFVLGETYDPLVIGGISGCDLASLAIYLYDPSTGVVLAGAFNVVETTPIAKNLDRYQAEVNFLSQSLVDFFGATPPETKNAMLVIRDSDIVYCKCLVPVIYVPGVNAGPEPEVPALAFAIETHNVDPDAHVALVACSQIPDLSLNALDDTLTFSSLLTNFNLLVAALRTPRT